MFTSLSSSSSEAPPVTLSKFVLSVWVICTPHRLPGVGGYLTVRCNGRCRRFGRINLLHASWGLDPRLSPRVRLPPIITAVVSCETPVSYPGARRTVIWGFLQHHDDQQVRRAAHPAGDWQVEPDLFHRLRLLVLPPAVADLQHDVLRPSSQLHVPAT
ncbi:uncharacterized protein LOC121879471 [Homarus americanus]|uniref:uncharacterized protein LOC121879471 n=1 Tax=Homarus americanus TaxID=6706 RepID=UPI001C46E9F8|nr:uncharacterized protein LOC121879471 [Homarus americanus]